MPKRPNILFMIADDHRHDAIAATGDLSVQTPVLDGLIADGVALREMHIMGGTNVAVCIPTRASLLTGTNVFRAIDGLPAGKGYNTLSPDCALLPQTFRENGYTTHITGKWHNDKSSCAQSFCSGENIFFGGMWEHTSIPVHPFDAQGVFPQESVRTDERFSSELFADTAVNFLESYTGDDPFFLYVAFTAPHDPRTPPEEYARLYNPEHIPLPENFLPEHPFDNGDLLIRDELLAEKPHTAEEIQRHIADYYGMISHLDAQIGRILTALQQNGYADDTIIVYTADHGLAVGQHGLMGKQNLYDHSIRIPCILTGPGLPQRHSVEGLTWQIDIFPTLCELAGLPIPPSLDGRSAVPLITGEQVQLRETVCALYKDYQRMIKTSEWKLIRYFEQNGKGTQRVQLFHLASDPWEREDLAHDPAQAARIQELSARLDEWRRSIGDPLA